MSSGKPRSMARRWRLAVFWALPALVAGALHAQGSDRVITSVDFFGDVPSDRRQLGSRASELSGTIYSPYATRKAVEDLYATGLFSQVEAFATEDVGGVRLRFHLTAKTFVSSLSIIGNSALTTAVLLSEVTLKQGTEYAPNLLLRDVEALCAAYLRRGYFQTRIESGARVPGKTAEILYRINEGPLAVFGPLSIDGARAYREKDLIDAIGYREGAPYSAVDAEGYATRLRAYYRRGNYLAVDVDPPIATYDATSNRASVRITVRESRKVELQFDGNLAFSDDELRRRVQLESVNAFGFRKAAADLRTLYLREGYFQAQIDTPTVYETESTMTVTFPIQESERRYIDEVRIEGNGAFSSHALTSRMRTRSRGRWTWVPLLGRWSSRGIFDPLVLDADRNVLEVFYRSQGYRAVRTFGDARLEDSSRKLVVVVRVQEGPQWVVRAVGVQGNTAVRTSELLGRLTSRVGDPYDDEKVVADRVRIREHYSARGYRHADVPSPEFDPASGRLVYHVTEGRLVRIGAVSVRFLNENPKTRPYVILRELLVREGALYSAPKLAESRQRILRLGFFSTVQMTPSGFYEAREVVDIRIVVRERGAGSVNVSGGYSPSEGVRGTLEVVQRNLLGSGRRIGGKVRLGTLGSRYEATFVEPWTVWTRTRTTVRAFRDDLEEQDNTLTTGGLANLSRTVYRHNLMSLNYRYQRFSLTDPKEGSTVESVGVLPTLSGLGASFQRDTRDSLFDATRGWFHEASVEVSGGPLGGESQFLRATADMRYFARLGRTVWAAQTRFGYGSRLGSDREISSTERFRLGGSTSVRGYAERSLGKRDAYGNYRGDVLAFASTELRIPVYRVVGTALFADAGNVWQSLDDVSGDPIKMSAGVGLRVQTPIGPARVDVAFPFVQLRDDPKSTRVWVALGNAF